MCTGGHGLPVHPRTPYITSLRAPETAFSALGALYLEHE